VVNSLAKSIYSAVPFQIFLLFLTTSINEEKKLQLQQPAATNMHPPFRETTAKKVTNCEIKKRKIVFDELKANLLNFCHKKKSDRYFLGDT